MPQLEAVVDPAQVATDDEFTVAIGTSQLRPDTAAKTEFAVVLDASPSMSWPAQGEGQPGPTRWDLARQGALALLAEIADEAQVHVVLFADTARVVTAGSAAKLRRSLDRELPPAPPPDFRGTNIDAALTTAYGCLGASTATSRTVVLLTDGEPNMGRTRPEDLAAIAADATGRDMYLRPIGMGVDANVNLLMAMSSDGSADHVKSTADAASTITRVMGQLGAAGRGVVASGGDLEVVVSPHFTVLGTYQVAPSRRRLDRAAQVLPDNATRITLGLGAIGAGDDRPVFALRLRAPSIPNGTPVPVLRCGGEIRTARGPLRLDEVVVKVQLTVDGGGYLDGATLDIINGIDMEAEVGQQLLATPEEYYEAVYDAARQRAVKANLGDLADKYARTLRNLRAGEAPRDVVGEDRATSSKATTRPRRLLRNVPFATPRPRVEARPTVHDDDDDDDYTPVRERR